MKNFWDDLTPLNLWLYIVGLVLVAFILVMYGQGAAVSPYIWGLFGVVFTLITGIAIPTPSTTNLLKTLQAPNTLLVLNPAGAPVTQAEPASVKVPGSPL